jgi:hypothetical protein
MLLDFVAERSLAPPRFSQALRATLWVGISVGLLTPFLLLPQRR